MNHVKHIPLYVLAGAAVVFAWLIWHYTDEYFNPYKQHSTHIPKGKRKWNKIT